MTSGAERGQHSHELYRQPPKKTTHRKAGWLGGDAGMVLIVITGILVAACGTSGKNAANPNRTTTSAPPTSATGPPSLPAPTPTGPVVAGTWKLLPHAPVTRLSADTTAVWTGQEMIIHGNYYPGPGGVGFRGVTFAYRPATRTWVRLANSPSSPSAFQTTDAAVWTGSRELVFGQTSASYDPATNTWRRMLLGAALSDAVTGWTGHLFFAWGGTCCMDQSHDGTVYNVASNTWRQLPTAPLSPRRSASGTWAGHELVVAGGFRFGPGEAIIPLGDAAAYMPTTGTWRKIAPMPWPDYGATAVWDGKEVLFIGGVQSVKGSPARGLAYSPAANRWRLLPAMAYPRTGFAAVWTGQQLLVWGGLTANGVPPPHGEAYTPATSKWTALPASPLHGRKYPVAVWTGGQMIIWGGSIPNASNPSEEFLDGAAYTPAR